MKKQYKIAKGGRIFIYIFLAAAITGFSVFVFKETVSNNLLSYKVIISILFIILFVVAGIDTFLYKIKIGDRKISKTNILGEKSISFDAIKGFRKEEKHVVIVAKNEEQKDLRISNYLENAHEFIDVLYEDFPDLISLDYFDAEEELYENREFGRTEEEIDAHINQTKKLTRALNYSAVVFALWFIFYPQPYNLLIIINTLFPLVGLIVVYYYKGLIRLIKTDNSPYLSLSSCFLFPLIALMLRSYIDFDIISYNTIWVLSSAIGLFSLILIVSNNNSEFNIKNKFERFASYLIVFVCAGACTFCCASLINCAFDSTSPQIYKAQVSDKRISKGRKRPDRFLIEISRCCEEYDVDEVSVTYEEYNQINIDDSVCLNVYKGLLSAEWLMLGSFESLSESKEKPVIVKNDYTVDMIGKVIYENRDNATGFLLYVLKDNDTIINITSDSSSFFIPLPIKHKYKLGFKKEGYISKHLTLDFENCGTYEDYKYGFEFPMELRLEKGKSGTSMNVATLKYDNNLGYIVVVK